MAPVTFAARTAGGAATGALLAVLRAYAQVLFSRSPLVGALLLAATATNGPSLVLGLFAVATAAAAARLLGLDAAATGQGPYGYNALLVGLGVAHTFAADGAAVAFVLATAVAGVLVTAALSSTLGKMAGLPVLSLPFVAVFALALGVAPFVGLAAADLAAHDALAESLPAPLAFVLRSLGSLFFLPRVDAGALVLAALVTHSRIATLLAALAFMLVFAVTRSGVDPALVQSLALNAVLTASALGGVWFVPSRSSFVFAMVAALLAIGLTVGLWTPCARVGLPLLIFPFNATVLLALFAMRQRPYDRLPKSVDFVPGSPEENVAYYQTRVARFRALYPVVIRLPFRGAWSCTQGKDGALTHQGPWRHAFDFEVRGADGRLFRSDGATPEDHHCHRLPVLAAADGVVVKIENAVADNAIGGLELERNWGNVVVVRHGEGLYSLVAHLAHGSVVVREGQVVRRGDLVGLCGSSGRSPRPHLHFQLQSAPELGAPTMPCRFQEVVARAELTESLELGATPREGDLLRNLEPDESVAAYFAFAHGETRAFQSDGAIEHVTCEVDPIGRCVLRSREHGAALFFGKTEDGFTSFDVLGGERSALHLLRAALSRVPFDGSESLRWTDYLPARWSRWRLLRELVLPFVSGTGLAIDYRARRDGDLLVITGTSRRRSAAGAPLVRTKAMLSKTRGLIAVEVSVGQRHLVAEQTPAHAALTRNARRRARRNVTNWFRGALVRLAASVRAARPRVDFASEENRR